MLALVLGAAACGSDGDAERDVTAEAGADTSTTDEPAAGDPEEAELFPDVIEADITPELDGTFTVDATLSSPYDTPDRYADAWRVLAPDGTELGVRELAHDHQAEQPFTRSLGGVEIPAGVDQVIIEGRDQVSGWGGATLALEVPR